MSKRIYIPKLPASCSEAQLKRLFGKYGAITSVGVRTGRPRGFGFGFVEFADPKAAAAALKAGVSLEGRKLLITDRDTG